jgi:hypothetical protein
MELAFFSKIKKFAPYGEYLSEICAFNGEPRSTHVAGAVHGPGCARRTIVRVDHDCGGITHLRPGGGFLLWDRIVEVYRAE